MAVSMAVGGLATAVFVGLIDIPTFIGWGADNDGISVFSPVGAVELFAVFFLIGMLLGALAGGFAIAARRRAVTLGLARGATLRFVAGRAAVGAFVAGFLFTLPGAIGEKPFGAAITGEALSLAASTAVALVVAVALYRYLARRTRA
ncbi:hypothetical protein C8E83_1791 [Frondihabitans australicus]|uniref:Uncharacterized protein n=2 Tax=Frondihabitans australicus TaxID=386892 RepID=A0A495IFE5_9MICO|nr:hypothetical protein C8E83_1791 [Frondihabitans australicus]